MSRLRRFDKTLMEAQIDKIENPVRKLESRDDIDHEGLKHVLKKYTVGKFEDNIDFEDEEYATMVIDMWQVGESCYLECDSKFSEEHVHKLNPRNFRGWSKEFRRNKLPRGTYFRAFNYDMMWIEDYTLFPNGVYLEREDDIGGHKRETEDRGG